MLLNNKSCIVRKSLVDLNATEPIYYPFGVTPYKPGKNCNTRFGLYDRLWTPNWVKKTNSKVFNMITGLDQNHG